jgi:hypothetical protein
MEIGQRKKEGITSKNRQNEWNGRREGRKPANLAACKREGPNQLKTLIN